MSNTPNINIGVINESSVASQTQVGKILFTEQGNQYIVRSDNSKLKITDIITVSTLPTVGQANKIYILSSQNYSLNYYDTSWHTLSGSNQIIVGTIAPIDTSKLFLDISLTTKPILKWFDSTTTSWINISSTQIQSDWNQTDNTKADYIKNKPSGSNATSINNITIDDSTRSNGTSIVYNSSTGKYENATINVVGTIGSSTITTAGENVTIASGTEKTFSHPTSDKIVVSIEEQIAGSSVTDTHVDFSDSSKYTLQDSSKITANTGYLKLNLVSFNPNDKGSNFILSNNNLTAILNSGDNFIRANKGISSGKWYFEFKQETNTSSNRRVTVGVLSSNAGNKDSAGYFFSSATNGITTGYSFGYENWGGMKSSYASSSESSYGNSWGVGDIISILLDMDNKNITFWKNGVSQGTAFTNLPSIELYPAFSVDASFGGSTQCSIKFSSNSFIYTPPAGYNVFTDNSNYYLQTTGLSDYSLTTIDTITSLTVPTTIPTNTSIKCLFSVDGKNNWLYYDGSSIKKFIGDISLNWGSTSSSISQIQTLFTNMTITNLNIMLSSLGITSINLDFCFQLGTASLLDTPTISPITIVYTSLSHNEFASIGSYSDSYSTYGIKRISNSSLGVKNLTSKSRAIKISVVTSV